MVWKDPVIVPIGKAKNSDKFDDMMVMPATKDIWERNTSLTALMSAVNGLCTGIDMLLHPSIISADSVKAMFRQLIHFHKKTNGKEDPYHVVD